MNRWTGWTLATLALAACGGPEHPATTAERGAPRDVAAVPVSRVGGTNWYRAAGVVAATRRAELATRAMARIENVAVRAGDRVRAGQLLVSLDPSSQRAAGDQAEAGLELATSNLRRMERLYADSAVPLAQLEAARTGFEQAQGQVAAAKAELGYARIVAPFAGVVTARLADPGDLAAPGQPVLVVEDEGPREIVVALPERLALAVGRGDSIEVEIGSEARVIAARVRAVIPSAEPGTRTVEVRLVARERLVTNVAAVARIPVATEGDAAISVPVESVLERGQLAGVFVFAPDSTVRLRWVRLGRVADGRVEVVSGLRPDDLVARDPTAVRDGEPARPILVEVGDQ
ncbi:MAG: efflux RND transporter periplasmic adaptor subunit [Gemmatimonadales bacterium]